ncbi:hypothetical protein F5Y00DRAFT_268430 [Daldinia vernicosa]|uniref:uncharacterized protein n=1 Tax=Daldinia vernicosa TaxID=114800 RepID=UPI002007D156|nr:uncharacterized protein F5Y00DRAFT_268430 [Daldinia vernicosa]KAI0850295.1 hypothetical protein F5Y00DRAFT_268430 [Daldinia vernicosa]
MVHLEARGSFKDSDDDNEEMIKGVSSGRSQPRKCSPRTTSSQHVRRSGHEILSNTWRSWKWEILSCVLVLASPLVILATLYPYDGRPLPQWPFRVSVNTLLSIYSMVLKTGLAFVAASCIGQLQWIWFSQGRPIYDLVRYDNARQGPWGSLQLLWAQRLCQPITALGGLLLILSVGIDPLIQQLIGLYDCSVVVDDKIATLPRTNKFDDQEEVPTTGYEIQSAISQGIGKLGNGLYPDCATGNCSFPNSYGTLGYCSLCEDISNEITIDTTYTPLKNSTDWPYANGTIVIKSSLPEGIYSINDERVSSRLNVTYSIITSEMFPQENFGPGGVEVAKMSQFCDDCDDQGYSNRPERITVRILAGKTTFSDKHIDMSTGQTIRGCGNGSFINTWNCRGYGAATCVIQPCIRVHNSTVKAGHLSEHLLTQSGNLELRNRAVVDIECLTPQNKSKLIDQGYVIDETLRWLPYNVSTDVSGALLPINMTGSLLAQKCLYFIANGFLTGSGSFEIRGNFDSALKGVGGKTDDKGMIINEFDGSDIIRNLYNYGHIDFNYVQDMFTNISESLTTYIRTNGDKNYSEPAIGQVFHYATCIKVQWQWIAFPSSLALMTILLFVWTVCSKEPRSFPAWKASPLPWLMYGPEGSRLFDMDELEEIEHEVDEMENISKEVIITWKLLPNPHIQT